MKGAWRNLDTFSEQGNSESRTEIIQKLGLSFKDNKNLISSLIFNSNIQHVM